MSNIKDLKDALQKIEKQIEKAAELARNIESTGKELPPQFWHSLDNCLDELNQTQSSLRREKT